MLDKLRQEALRRGMRLLSNPSVARALADPRLLGAITKGLEFKGRVEGGLERKLGNVATVLRLATRDDLTQLEQTLEGTLRRVEQRCGAIERRIESTAPAAGRGQPS